MGRKVITLEIIFTIQHGAKLQKPVFIKMFLHFRKPSATQLTANQKPHQTLSELFPHQIVEIRFPQGSFHPQSVGNFNNHSSVNPRPKTFNLPKWTDWVRFKGRPMVCPVLMNCHQLTTLITKAALITMCTTCERKRGNILGREAAGLESTLKKLFFRYWGWDILGRSNHQSSNALSFTP